MFKTLTFITFFSVSAKGMELIKVKKISSTKKTFIINQGASTGIFKGQVASFTTKYVSFIAKTTEVNRFESLWSPLSETLLIPFNEGQFVEKGNLVEPKANYKNR